MENNTFNTVQKHIQEILKRSEDTTHSQTTPFDLCDEMLNKLPKLNRNQKILVMFNLEFLYKIKKRIGSLENVWFITPCEELKKKAAISMGVNENHVRIYSYKDKEVKELETMPKFDVVVGNPPYKGGMHLDFLKIAFEISSQWIIWLHPTIWIFNEKKNRATKKFDEIKDLIANHIKEIQVFNGNPIFNLGLPYTLGIDSIDKKINNQGKIKIIDMIQDKIVTFDNINDVNKWSDKRIYPKLKRKILNLSNMDNLLNHKNEQVGNYFINLPLISGRADTEDPKKLFLPHFFAPITPKTEIDPELRRRKWGPSRDFFFSFAKKKDAQNFLDFLKTRWAMFSLSILKNNQNLNRGELKSIPWLDWSEPWSEEKFEKLIQATPQEIKFVKENIPDYYGIAND